MGMRTTPTIIAESFMADLSPIPKLMPLPSGLHVGSEIDMEALPVPGTPRPHLLPLDYDAGRNLSRTP